VIHEVGSGKAAVVLSKGQQEWLRGNELFQCSLVMVGMNALCQIVQKQTCVRHLRSYAWTGVLVAANIQNSRSKWFTGSCNRGQCSVVLATKLDSQCTGL
jgi:hypothetical protein